MLFVFLFLILIAFILDIACCITEAKESQKDLYRMRKSFEPSEEIILKKIRGKSLEKSATFIKK